MPKGASIVGDDLILLRSLSDRVTPKTLALCTGMPETTICRAVAGCEISTWTASRLLDYAKKEAITYAKNFITQTAELHDQQPYDDSTTAEVPRRQNFDTGAPIDPANSRNT